jgi:hypothetical protein
LIGLSFTHYFQYFGFPLQLLLLHWWIHLL